MNKWMKGIGVFFFGALLCLPSPGSVLADYPDRPITMIISFGPGGATDLSTRALSKALEKQLGQPIIVTNKPGGGTAVGISAIASAKADGYTIGTTLWTGPALLPHTMDVSFGVDSFDYIAIVGRYLFGVAVRSDSEIKTLKDLTDHAKANPGKVKYSVSGIATPPHLAMVSLGKATGVKWDVVPYKSGAEAATALLGGHVDFTSGNPLDVIPFIEAGKMRFLASMSDIRWKWLPDVPTVRELGYNFDMNAFLGYGAPKGVPEAVMKKLSDAFSNAFNDPEFQQNLEKAYVIPELRSGAEYKKMLTEESKRNEELLRELGLHKSQKK
jgi:tripartite-type tricarboxylate transporter receptor subunit TctC